MSYLKSTFAFAKSAALAITAVTATAGTAEVTLHGASLFHEDRAYTKALREFERMVGEAYYGDISFEMHLNGELGDESDFVTFLQQGVAIDYAIMAPSNMAVFAPSIPLMDMPFLFRDLDHWKTVLSSDVLAPLEEQVYEAADIKVIGYAGGGRRNLASANAISNMDELTGHKMRVMGAPIQNLKFYEFAPNITLAWFTITVRPLTLSGKTFRVLPEDLRAIILEAGAKAGAAGREIESSEGAMKLQKMADAVHITVTEFEGREQLLDLAVQVQDDYAAELDATDLLEAIRAK